MHINSFFKSLLFLASILLFVSCDKEYNSVGDTLIGDNHFDLSKYTSNVLAYNEKITPIESDNLPINALGIYDNHAFGKTIASFVTQLSLSTSDPVFGPNPVIDSVYVDVPYFSHLDPKNPTDATSGNSTYILDSIYGEPKAKIKLSVYESGRYMGNQNGLAQTFYTNQNSEFDSYKIGSRLNDDSKPEQNDAFFFQHRENRFVAAPVGTAAAVTTRTAPSMRLLLNKDFFKNKILNAPAGSLSNDVFTTYFKGLYFKVEQSGSDKGALANINFAKGTITIKYKEDTSLTDATRLDKMVVLNMSGTTASFLEQSNTNTNYSNATSTPNRVGGDDRLYLKGGEGSLAVLNLFGPDLYGADGITGTPNGVADQLDIIRKNKWLINEANLVFNIDAPNMAGSYEPNRIYLFDLNNRRPIVDYYVDQTSARDPKMSRLVFDGNINRDPNSTTIPKRGLTYKIRITNHIRNLVKYADSTNVKLGIAVTESIDIANSNIWRTPATPPIPQIPYYTLAAPKVLKYRNIEAPKASVMNPLGTILYGTGATSTNLPEDKKLKLEIFYTKPK